MVWKNYKTSWYILVLKFAWLNNTKWKKFQLFFKKILYISDVQAIQISQNNYFAVKELPNTWKKTTQTTSKTTVPHLVCKFTSSKVCNGSS